MAQGDMLKTVARKEAPSLMSSWVEVYHTIPLNNRNRGAVSYGSLRFLLYLCQALGLKHEGHIRQTHRFPVLPEGYKNTEVEY